MKIDNSGKPIASNLTRPATSRTVSADKKTEATQQESVSINPLAAKMQAMETSGNAPVFDAEKVASIRQAISEGKFTVRSDAVADKLVVSVRELLEK